MAWVLCGDGCLAGGLLVSCVVSVMMLDHLLKGWGVPRVSVRCRGWCGGLSVVCVHLGVRVTAVVQDGTISHVPGFVAALEFALVVLWWLCGAGGGCWCWEGVGGACVFGPAAFIDDGALRAAACVDHPVPHKWGVPTSEDGAVDGALKVCYSHLVGWWCRAWLCGGCWLCVGRWGEGT